MEFLNIWKVEAVVDNYIEDYIDELVKTTPFLTRGYYYEHYGDVFESSKKRYVESYRKGLEVVYSDEDLNDMVKHYKTEEGQPQLSKKFYIMLKS